jgi:hypothetical protein
MSSGIRRVWSIMIVLSGAWVAACHTEATANVAAYTPTPRPIVSVTVPITPQPVAVQRQSPVTPLFTPTTPALVLHDYTLHGVIYDAAVDTKVRLIDAQLTWRYAAKELQLFDGEIVVDENGAYQLQLHMRPEDEVVITAFEPGYQASTIRLRGDEVGDGAVQLNAARRRDRRRRGPAELRTVPRRSVHADRARRSGDSRSARNRVQCGAR